MVWRSFIMSVCGHRPPGHSWLKPEATLTLQHTWIYPRDHSGFRFSPIHSMHTYMVARGLGKPRFMEKHSRQGLPAVYLPHTPSPSVPTHSKWGIFPKATSHFSFVHLCNEFALYFQDCNGKTSTPFPAGVCEGVCLCLTQRCQVNSWPTQPLTEHLYTQNDLYWKHSFSTTLWICSSHFLFVWLHVIKTTGPWQQVYTHTFPSTHAVHTDDSVYVSF